MRTTWAALLEAAPLIHARLALGPAENYPKPRDHAYTDGETVWIAPRMLNAPMARVIGVLAHELGHVALLRSGVDPHSEREADLIAEEMFGLTINYDGDDVQTVARGVRPRPARLG